MTRPALLIRTGALGDFVLSLSVVEAVRAAGYGPITMVGRREFVELARSAGRVTSVLDMESHAMAGLFREGGMPATLRQQIAEQALVIYWSADPDNVLARNLGAAATGILIRLEPKAMHGSDQHIVAQWQAVLASHNLTIANPTLPPHGFPGPATPADVILHPGSGGRAKCWPLPNYLRLARDLAEDGNTVTFSFGPVEEDWWGTDGAAELERYGPVLRDLPLPELCGLLASARCYLGNDSGPTHLAAALGVPVVAVFGPATSPQQWRPLGERVTVLGHPEWPGQEEVLAAVRAYT